MAMPMPFLLVTAIVMPSFAIMIIVGAYRVHADSTDHASDNEPYHNLADGGSNVFGTCCFHTVTRFLDIFQAPVWRQSLGSMMTAN